MSTPPVPSRLKCQHTLALHSFTLSLIDSVVSEVKKLPEWQAKRLDNELTKSVSKMVRDEIIGSVGVHLSYAQAASLDKKVIVVDALRKCFDLSDAEASLVETQVEFFLDNRLVRARFLSFVLRGLWSLLPKSLKR